MNIRAHPWLICLFCALAAPLAAALSAVASAKADDLKIVRVQPGWRDAGSFKRISEYFDGRENTGGQLVLRSRPDTRAGCYFFMRVTNPGALVAAIIKLTLITPRSATPKSFTFAANLPPGDTVLNLGLTGPDWPDPKANPVAWKLEFLAADGRPLATEQSFLWEKSAAN